ncbi:MAG: hypothetical protein H6607_09315 [Flavobacteriales bacterium]|nr:hypothetical protein [Flavobacteriales bacterium]
MPQTPQKRKISELSSIEFINCFSLLVVFGSVSTSFFFGKLFRAQLPFSFYWVLATTIWVIYSIDHILDGNKMKEKATSIRHIIHFEYQKPILAIVAALVVFNAFFTVAFLPIKIVYAGILVAALVIAYFLFVHYFKYLKISWLKELFVATIACVGMAVMPGIAGNLSTNIASVFLLICLVFINFTNLILFSYYDYDNDIAGGLKSAATRWGKEKTRNTILYLLTAAFFSFMIWLFSFHQPIKMVVTIPILLMMNTLLIIWLQEERFKENELYRFWGDLIFMFPGILWLLLDKFSYGY